MDIERMKEKYLIFSMVILITTLIIFLLSSVIEGTFNLEPYITLNLYDSILLIPFVILIFRYIDLSNKELLDEYLFTVILGILFGLFLADLKDFIKFIITDGILLYIFYYLIIIFLIIIIIRIIKLIKKV